MKKLLPFLLLVSILAQCGKNPEGKLLHEYTWTDSIINYKFYRDSLVISFPVQPKVDIWSMNFVIYEEQSNKDIIAPGSQNYKVENKKISIKMVIPDTIQPEDLRLFLMANPLDGYHFFKEKSKYEMRFQVRYFQDSLNPGRLKAMDFVRKNKILMIPYGLLQGSDSAFYKKELKKFIKDSCEVKKFP